MNPTVSIYVATYNHENYIARALSSIRMQQTDFPFEVFVGEDCSTDNTRQVLKAWEQANPDDRFHIFYRQQNMHKLPLSNPRDLRMRCKGKYIIALEGDDFWTDPHKLQKQVDFLESHPDYYAVAHNCVVVGEDGSPNGEVYPECKEETYTFRHYASDIMPGQLTTFLCHNYMTDPAADMEFLNSIPGPGDRKVYFAALCLGKIHCMQAVMSAYRHITAAGSSFSATYHFDYRREEQNLRTFLDFAYKNGNPDAIKYAEMLYLRNIRHAKRKKLAPPDVLKADKKHIQHALRAAALLLKRDVNYRIFHRKLHV